MPVYCEICGATDGRATLWFDATTGNYSPDVDDITPPLSTYQICYQCQDRLRLGQWTYSFTPNILTVTVVTTGGQSQVIH